MAALKGDALNVSGATMPGLPFVMMGRNEQIAWGLIDTLPDLQDLVVEEINPLNKNQYRAGDLYLNMDVKFEKISIKSDFLRPSRKPKVIAVRRTRHGPLLSDESNPLGDVAFSLRWAGDDDGGGTFNSFVKLNYARNWAEFTSALSTHVVPAYKVLYADRAGNIGYAAAGLSPIRRMGNGSLPIPGWHLGEVWAKSAAVSGMPSLYNPAEGLIVAGDSGAQRIHAELQRKLRRQGKVSVDDMTSLQMMAMTPVADSRLVDKMLASIPSSDGRKEALTRLANWDGQLSGDSNAAAIFVAWTTELRDVLLAAAARPDSSVDALPGLTPPDRARVIERALLDPGQKWCGRYALTTGSSCGALLSVSLDRALSVLGASLGEDQNKWKLARLRRPEAGPRPLFGSNPASARPHNAAVDVRHGDAGGLARILRPDNLVGEAQHLLGAAAYRQVIGLDGTSTSVIAQAVAGGNAGYWPTGGRSADAMLRLVPAQQGNR